MCLLLELQCLLLKCKVLLVNPHVSLQNLALSIPVFADYVQLKSTCVFNLLKLPVLLIKNPHIFVA